MHCFADSGKDTQHTKDTASRQKKGKMENIERREEYIPIERYTLTLRREYVASNGKTYKIGDPIVVTCTNLSYGRTVCPVNDVIRVLTEKMESEAIQIYSEGDL